MGKKPCTAQEKDGRSPMTTGNRTPFSSRGSDTPESHRPVGSAKPEGIGNGRFDLHLACLIRTVVQVTALILVEDVDRRRRNLMVNRQGGEYGFYSPAAPKRCPVMDLVEFMTVFLVASPKARLTAWVSATSPEVEVP